MPDLNFQLVFQFDATTPDAFPKLMELMHNIEQHLESEHDVFVDGNDFGMGQFNIFMHTNEPMKTFNQTAEFIGAIRPPLAFSAGYRAFADDKYISLFPPGDQAFAVL